jgi:Mitochondrial genome maintenance MGM101
MALLFMAGKFCHSPNYSPSAANSALSLVSLARGEQQYFDPEGIPTATEGCKSNALMRCCKDLGIASELWDPVFIRKFMAEHSKQVWVEHMTTKKKRLLTMRKDVKTIPYPFKEAAKA